MNMMIGSHYSGLGTIYPGCTALSRKSLVCSINFAELEMRVMSHLMSTVNTCPRVAMRMECPECRYPFSEAMYPLDLLIRHKCPMPHCQLKVSHYIDAEFCHGCGDDLQGKQWLCPSCDKYYLGNNKNNERTEDTSSGNQGSDKL